MKTRHWFVTLTLVCCVAALLAGCTRSPRINYYALEPVARAEAALLAQNGPTVALASLTLPEMVDRPQMVVRADGARVEILETQRWAEPLKSAIPRLLASNLSRLLGSARVSIASQSGAGEADYRIFVDMPRFEATAGSVTVEAAWTISRPAQGFRITGRSQVSEPRSGEGYEALVSAYNRALAAVSREMAQAIVTQWTAPR
jgi:uncharacterized lipoprotein YmbA